MNRLLPIAETVDIACPACLHWGRLRAQYRGQQVRCKRCLACFVVPAVGSRLGISSPVTAPAPGTDGASVRTLGIAWPAAEERAAPSLRVYAG